MWVCACVDVWVCLLWWIATVSLSTDLDRAEQMRWFRSQSIVLAPITSAAGAEQILWVEVDDGAKPLSRVFFPCRKNLTLQKRKKRYILKPQRLGVFFKRQRAVKEIKGHLLGVYFFHESSFLFSVFLVRHRFYFHILLCVYFLFIRLQPSYVQYHGFCSRFDAK